jgi:hypothetical protein
MPVKEVGLHMQYKDVPISDSVSLPVPLGLTRDEEAQFIAARMAYVNMPQVEAECQEMLELWHAGKLIPVETVLEELAQEEPAPKGKTA